VPSRITAAAILALTFAIGCASGPKRPTRVDVALIQLVGPSDVGTGSFGGPMSIQYQLVIRNRLSTPITLRQVTLQTPVPGAYALRGVPNFFKETIQPGERASVTFWAPGIARGSRTGNEEPVTIRGIAYFVTDEGDFQELFIRTLSQFSER
jgi:hypothetical protein